MLSKTNWNWCRCWHISPIQRVNASDLLLKVRICSSSSPPPPKISGIHSRQFILREPKTLAITYWHLIMGHFSLKSAFSLLLKTNQMQQGEVISDKSFAKFCSDPNKCDKNNLAEDGDKKDDLFHSTVQYSTVQRHVLKVQQRVLNWIKTLFGNYEFLLNWIGCRGVWVDKRMWACVSRNT